MKYHVLVGGDHFEVEVAVDGAGVCVTIDGEPRHVDVATLDDGSAYSLVMSGRSVDIGVEERDETIDLLVGGTRYSAEVLGEREYLARAIRAENEGGDSRVCAVMTGILRDVRVAPGDTVAAGQVLFILEAMKMENEVKAEVAGVVASVHAEAGATVEQGDLVVEIEAAEG